MRVTERQKLALRRPRVAKARQVVALERRLGAKLVHRTTRILLLTEDGGAFYERAKRILGDVDNDPAIEMTLTAWLQESFGDPAYWDSA